MALEIKGEQKLPVSQAELWRLLNDPEVLAKTIPGCNSVRALGEDCYEMGLKLQVANVFGEYMGSVAITEKRDSPSEIASPSSSTLFWRGMRPCSRS